MSGRTADFITNPPVLIILAGPFLLVTKAPLIRHMRHL
jgi:hypothetical protein